MRNEKYDDLQVALNVARDNLKSLNEKIGRGDQFRDTRKRQHWDRDNGNGQQKSGDERPARVEAAFQIPGGGIKRARNNVFSRLEPRQQHQQGNRINRVEPRQQHQQGNRLSSRVTKEIPRREDVVAAQQSDEQSRARNKRMFGSLLGTLNKFCQDESRLKGHVEKKAIIEKKVEEQEIRERETSKIERRNLLVDRKKKLNEVRLLEVKMERMQDLAVWEENHKKTYEFIGTSVGPRIYFLPKVMNEKSTQLLQESQKQYQEELIKKREDVQRDLAEVEDRLQRDLEKALEEKPINDAQSQTNFKREEMQPNSSDDEVAEQMSEDEEEEQEDERRPRLVSQVVKSQVEISIKNHPQSDRPPRHVLQSTAHKNMIISVVNNTYEGGGSNNRRF